MFNWIDGNNYSGVATLYPNNFTLNNVLAHNFKDNRWCCIGINDQTKQVAIKPVSKREVDLELVPLKQLHKVSIGKGYARISNKSIIDIIAVLINKECNGIKFSAHFDETERMLIIDLNKQINKEWG